MLGKTFAADSGSIAASASTCALDTAAASDASSNNASSKVPCLVAEDYLVLASLPTPNKSNFNADGVPGES